MPAGIIFCITWANWSPCVLVSKGSRMVNSVFFFIKCSKSSMHLCSRVITCQTWSDIFKLVKKVKPPNCHPLTCIVKEKQPLSFVEKKKLTNSLVKKHLKYNYIKSCSSNLRKKKQSVMECRLSNFPVVLVKTYQNKTLSQICFWKFSETLERFF